MTSEARTATLTRDVAGHVAGTLVADDFGPPLGSTAATLRVDRRRFDAWTKDGTLSHGGETMVPERGETMVPRRKAPRRFATEPQPELEPEPVVEVATPEAGDAEAEGGPV